ncbi:cytochrome P450 [Fennellomyces sp. T-0311]|nr:cytochrome P450 [Fennellomyces sp. T-0311]
MSYTSLLIETLGASAGNLLKRVKTTDKGDIEKIGKVASLIVAAYFFTSKLYDAFFGPLSKIPGPPEFKFYEMRYAPNIEHPVGTSWKKVKKWQDEYGDVVRLGPNRVLISNKRMLRQILIDDDFPKGPMYKKLQKSRGLTIFTTTEKLFHKQRRRTLSAVYSTKYISSLEPCMVSSVESFIRRIDSDIEETRNQNGFGQVDIWDLLIRLAVQIIGQAALGTDLKTLQIDDHPIPRNLRRDSEKVALVFTHPILSNLVLALPFSGLILGANNEMKLIIKQIVIDRIAGGEKARRSDILQLLVDSQDINNPNSRMSADAIAKETVAMLVGGSETTSNSIGFGFIELLKNPQVLCKLRDEIDTIEVENGQATLHHHQIKALPYLNAVINETLRLDSVAVAGGERIADKDTVLDGRLFVPKGTVIHMNVYHAQVNPVYWPSSEKFIPERWLEGSNIPADTEAFFPFSAGPRNCIGQAFALQEMRLVFANLVKLYDFEAIPEQMVAAEDRRSFLVLQLHGNSFKVLIKRREH